MGLCGSLLVLAGASVGLAPAARQDAAPPPNVILLMSDDQGWADVGYNGNELVRTPNLDAMAGAGLRFDHFYAAAPLCGPTRASCLTGRHPFRYGVRNSNIGSLPSEEETLAELLSARGYRTGHFGKWHLGTLTRTEYDSRRGGPAGTAFYSPPWANGFERCFSTEAKLPTWDPMRMPVDPPATTWWDALEDPDDPEASEHYHSQNELSVSYWDETGAKVTDNLAGDDSRVIMDRVLPFVRESAERERPFLAVVWFHTPHKPVVAGPDYAALYADLDGYERNYYGAITAMDEQIGRLREELRALGISQHTLLWFCSDNGPIGEGGDLRGKKGDLTEGGLRVPGVLEWPARVPEGRSCAVRATTSDLLPTVLAAAGVPLPGGRPYDGIDLLPAIDGELRERPTPIVFESERAIALIEGAFKLLSVDRGESFELYDLAADPGERDDLAAERPERVVAMSETLRRWLASKAEESKPVGLRALPGG